MKQIIQEIYDQVYQKNNFFGVDKKLKPSDLKKNTVRPNSIAIVGGALGDEGKGRVTDELTADFLRKFPKVIHYRDNGGANAGHTVEIGSMKVALHQLSAGTFQKGCVVVLGKEMVIHPEDLVIELDEVKTAIGQEELPATLHIDEMAFLCLDTHRAFEAVLKDASTGSKGSTGRGIAPAYADIIYRHPLRMRDYVHSDWKVKFAAHYKLYTSLLKGFNVNLQDVQVPRLDGTTLKVGTFEEMAARLEISREILSSYVHSVYELIQKEWASDTPFVFEKAQALGLDIRWGVYPDVTASDCGFSGILSSTQGLVDPKLISLKAATIKATYTSSVGSRILPTLMKNDLAAKIREEANEYGATTKRPRDIAYIDIPMLSFLMRVGQVEYLSVTHLDICYPNVPIKICTGYTLDKKSVDYRPDQIFLDTITPEYIELPSWDGSKLTDAKKISDLPKECLQYLAFLSKCLNVKIFMATTGPKREQTIRWI